MLAIRLQTRVLLLDREVTVLRNLLQDAGIPAPSREEIRALIDRENEENSFSHYHTSEGCEEGMVPETELVD